MEIVVCFFLLAAAYGIGSGLLPERRSDYELEGWLLRLGLGLALLGGVLAILGAIGALRPFPLLVSLYGLGVIGTVTTVRSRRETTLAPARRILSPLLAILLVFLILAVWRALLGNQGPDSYHIFFPKAFLLQGSLRPFPGVPESLYPSDLELLNIILLACGTGNQVSLMSAAFFVLTALALYHLLRQEGLRTGAWVGAGFVLTNPLLVRTAGTSHIENGQAFFLVLAVIAGTRAIESGTWRDTVVAGVILGFLAGTKDTAPLLLVPAALAMLIGPRMRRVRVPRLAATLTVAALPWLFWLVRKWVACGNPAYPFLLDIVPTARPYVAPALRLRAMLLPPLPGIGSRVIGFFQSLSFEATGEVFVGPLVLLMWPLLRKREAGFSYVLAPAVATAVGAAFLLDGQPRLLAPLMPVFARTAGVVVESLQAHCRRWSRAWCYGLAGIFLGALAVRLPLVLRYEVTTALLRRPPLTFTERRRLARTEDPLLAGVAEANGKLTDRQRVLVVSRQRHLEYLDVPFVPPSCFAQSEVREVTDLARASGCTHVLYLGLEPGDSGRRLVLSSTWRLDPLPGGNSARKERP